MSTLVRNVCAWTALFFLCHSSALRADVVFNNFGPGDSFPDAGRLLQGETFGTIGNVDQATAFTVGSSNYLLTDIRIGVTVSGPPNTGTGPLDLILATDAGGLPGILLKTFPFTLNNTGKQIVHATDAATLQLNAGATYWIIADAKGHFDGGWDNNNIGDLGPTAGRSDNGPWSLHGANDTRLTLRVEGNVAVPEPASFVVLCGSFIGLATLRRRHKS